MSLIRQDLVSSNKYNIKCPYSMNPIGISVHNTYNDASAKNEISYMKSNNNKVSYHIAVDDKEAIQGLPLNRSAYACGDGNGQGNRKHISIEICYSKSGGTRFTSAEKLAAKVVAELLKKYGWGIDRVKAHRDFAKKNCPHRTNMSQFKKMVEEELKCDSDTLTFKNGNYTGKKAKVTANVLNIRYDRGTQYNVIGKLNKGDIVQLNYCLNEWVSIEGYKGSKGLGYVSTDYLELL